MVKFNKNSQAGVTLMLAVLVLAAITAVAFSLATIVFIEVKSSGDELRTEPALYATIGVTEEALFKYKRFIGSDLNVVNCLPKNLGVCNLNNVTLTMPGSQPIQYDDSPKIQVIPKQSQISLPMYNANDFTKQYSSVTVTMLPVGSGANLDVYLLKTNNDGNGTDPTHIGEQIISEGSRAFFYNGFESTGQYDLVLDNTTNSEDATVGIATVRFNKPLTTDPDGLPFVGQDVLRIMANYLGLSRTYQVTIPIP